MMRIAAPIDAQTNPRMNPPRRKPIDERPDERSAAQATRQRGGRRDA